MTTVDDVIDVEVSGEITEPGIYTDLPADVYHADPVPAGSLSSSGARKLLPPSCPAVFDWERTHPRAATKAFDLGTAAHDAILGGGPQIVRCDFSDWRTRAAKDKAAEVRAEGGVPLLPDEWQQVQDMAAKLREHPIARALFDPDRGAPEQSLFWRDDETDVWRRARLDWLPKPVGRRLIIGDYKTSVSAHPDKFARSAADFGYHQQDSWYVDAVRAVGIDDDPAFVFVVQEKTAPYVVTVVQLNSNAQRIGRLLNRRAIDLFAECTRTGTWPGYTADVEQVGLPYWIEREFEDYA